MTDWSLRLLPDEGNRRHSEQRILFCNPKSDAMLRVFPVFL